MTGFRFSDTSTIHAFRKGGPTIGFLANTLTDSRTFGVWNGIIDSVERHGGRLLCFPAGRMDSVGHTRGNARTIVCNLINPAHIDGILIFQWFSGRAWFERIYEAYRPAPVVTIMRHYAGYPGILLDPYQDMRRELRHLIECHGYHRIGLVRGPKGHPTADARYRAYCDMLAEHQLPVDPRRVFTAAPYTKSFLKESPGEEAVQGLLDTRGLKPGADLEAIVAFNDEVAFGILDSLRERQIQVPFELAVVGFDNRTEAELTFPPLTTMAIPWFEIGASAADMLFAQLAGEPLNERETLAAKLMLRRSCGCLEPMIQDAASFPMQDTAAPPHQPSRALQDRIAAECRQDTRENQPAPTGDAADMPWLERLEKTLLQDLAAGRAQEPARGFLRAFEAGLSTIEDPATGEKIGHETLSWLRHHVVSTFSENRRACLQAENLLHQGRVLASVIARQIQKRQQSHLERQLAILHEISQRLLHTFDLASAMDILAQDLPLLGISGCYLALYEEPQPYQYPQPAPEYARLLLAYTQDRRLALPPEGLRFASRALLPDAARAEDTAFHNLVVEPLYSWEEQIGFTILAVGPRIGRLYEELRAELSYTLKATLFVLERRHSEKALQDSLHTLRLAQDQLVQNEKMAALGGLVAGVAHEINTPLGIGITAVSYLEQETHTLKRRYEQGNISRSALEEYLQMAAQSTMMISTNLSRAAEQIRSFKRISIDQTSGEQRRFGLRKLLDDVLLSLQPELKKCPCTVTVQCPEAIEPDSYPGALTQIITNLIQNSMLHGFAGRSAGEIRIEAALHAGQVRLAYTDTGAGMRPEQLPRIFEPFFTTKRGQGGSGLGLYIVYNLVTQRLRGTITCESRPEQGTTFYLEFPVAA